jgi:hypothetical protein
VTKVEKGLSREDRLRLIQTLNALPAAQFDEIVFALAPPQGNIPRDCASQSQRSQALLEWVESPIGPGLQAAEDLLNKVIAERVKIAPKFQSFVMSGKISSTTMPEICAFVQLLRKKTGDDSIDVAFYEEGSIRLILSGSTEGLEKLKELYDSGELESLDIPSVEDVKQVDNNTSAARKARLIQVLKLRGQSLSFRTSSRELTLTRALVGELTLTRALTRALNSALSLSLDLDPLRTLTLTRSLTLTLYRDLDLYHDRALTLARDLDLDLAGVRDLAINLAGVRDLAINLAGVRDLAIDLYRDLDLDLDLYRARARARAFNLAFNSRGRDLDFDGNLYGHLYGDRAHALDLALARTHAHALDLAHALAHALDLDLDLTNVDFKRTNLRNINLIGVDLTGADLSGAEVEGTIFGDNDGLLESDKRDLQARGAILLDSPESDVLSFVGV